MDITDPSQALFEDWICVAPKGELNFLLRLDLTKLDSGQHANEQAKQQTNPRAPSRRAPPVLRKVSQRFIRAALLLAACAVSSASIGAPETGDPAPDFSLKGSDGLIHSLAELRGRGVVIAFFPKAFTGG
ncbi:MAG: hypothetical protein ACI8Z1_003747 [Candidatus Azotimanducaceae bacterium]